MVRITLPVFSHKSDAVLPNVLPHPRHYPYANFVHLLTSHVRQFYWQITVMRSMTDGKHDGWQSWRKRRKNSALPANYSVYANRTAAGNQELQNEFARYDKAGMRDDASG